MGSSLPDSKSPKKPQYNWTILLLKENFDDESALRKGLKSRICDVVSDGKKIGRIAVVLPQDFPPNWVKKVKPFVPQLPVVGNRNSSAVALFEVKNRIFALTFGYGRSLLELDSWEEDFGLRVTLNLVPENGIRLLDRHSLDAFAQQTRTQGIRPGDFEQFGLDMEKDLLRAVVGNPANSKLGKRIAGADALNCTVEENLSEIPNLLKKYLAEYHSNAYLNKYPDLDRILLIRDKRRIEALDAKLLNKVRSGDFDRLHMAVPELVDWATAGFKYGAADYSPYPDLQWADFTKHLRQDLKKINLAGRRVYCVDLATSAIRNSWQLRSCLYWETTFESSTCIIANGKWYQIDPDFVARVNRYVDGLLQVSTLPEYQMKDRDEAGYNRRVAREQGLLHFDRRNVFHGGRRRDQIEPCDLLSMQKELFHVKRYSGSSVLSHLFAQGLVSSETLANDDSYREKFRTKLATFSKKLIPKRLNAEDYNVVYAIIGAKTGGPLSSRLPFFSRVTLRNAAKRLKKRGFKVSVQWVADASTRRKTI